MKLYILNSLITPFDEDFDKTVKFEIKKIGFENFTEILRYSKKYNIDIESVIGHQGTVDFLQRLLPEDVKGLIRFDRKNIYFQTNDEGLVFKINDRGLRMREFVESQLDRLFIDGLIIAYHIKRVE